METPEVFSLTSAVVNVMSDGLFVCVCNVEEIELISR